MNMEVWTGLSFVELIDKLYHHRWAHKLSFGGFEWPDRKRLSVSYPWLAYNGRTCTMRLAQQNDGDTEITSAAELKEEIERLSVMVLRESLMGYQQSGESRNSYSDESPL